MTTPELSEDAGGPASLERAAPETVGLSAEAIEKLLQAFSAHGIEMHSFMVARHGKVVAEAWWRPYKSDRVHMLHSVSKGFTATGVGLALHEGLLSLDDRVLSFFPDRAGQDASAHLREMRVRDLLTQTSGHGHGVSGSIWRGIATSWVDEFLKIDVPHAPGTHFQYSSATSFMLSAIVSKVSGVSLRDYLEPRVFAPLGMRSVRWDIGPEGINPGGNGVSATTEDLIKLAVLHAADGCWNGRRILPPGWVSRASQPAKNRPYGYHWWVWPGTPGLFAFGAFGQYAFVLPEEDFAMAMTAAVPGSISRPDIGIPPLVWKHLPDITRGPDASSASSQSLARHVQGLKLDLNPADVAAGCAAEVSSVRFVMDANPYGVEEVRPVFEGDKFTLDFRVAGRRHTVVAGLRGQLVEGATTLPGSDLHHGYSPGALRTVAGAGWTGPKTLTLECQYVETAFRDTFVLDFEGGSLSVSRRVNVNGKATAHEPVRAVRAIS